MVPFRMTLNDLEWLNDTEGRSLSQFLLLGTILGTSALLENFTTLRFWQRVRDMVRGGKASQL